jgi:hypothetical protein
LHGPKVRTDDERKIDLLSLEVVTIEVAGQTQRLQMASGLDLKIALTITKKGDAAEA